MLFGLAPHAIDLEVYMSQNKVVQHFEDQEEMCKKENRLVNIIALKCQNALFLREYEYHFFILDGELKASSIALGIK